MSRALVLIPTYNEAGNIEPLIHELMKLDTAAPIDILVRDDKSPDGTADIVHKLARKKAYKGRIFLENGDKKGLGAAMRSSFDSILKNYDHDIILTMDADFSHSPSDIVKLIDTINDGADIAIGSRYVAGGLIPGDWPLFFLIRTWVATRVARWLGGINEDIHELTTNMRAMRRHVLERIEYNRIDLTGYAFQIMLANELTRRKEWNVVEVPIAFRSRIEGNTKSRFVDIIEFFSVAYQLNPDSPAKESLRFMFVGLTGALINIFFLALSNQFLDIRTGYHFLIAIQASIVWNFIWHSRFTFRSRSRKVRRVISGRGLTDFVKYQLASAFGQLLTLSVALTLNSAGVYFILSQMLGILVAFIANYYISRTYIWSIKNSIANQEDLAELEALKSL